jgi:formamidopyrimidine-DNA glycosylase
MPEGDTIHRIAVNLGPRLIGKVLGPDVLADDFDSRQAASRAAQHVSRMIADVVLDQRIAAGIGNVYKSEMLFVRGIDPRTRVGQLDLARRVSGSRATSRATIATSSTAAAGSPAGAAQERSRATSSAIHPGGRGRARTANPSVGSEVSGYRSCSRQLGWSGLPDRTPFNSL